MGRRSGLRIKCPYLGIQHLMRPLEINTNKTGVSTAFTTIFYSLSLSPMDYKANRQRRDTLWLGPLVYPNFSDVQDTSAVQDNRK